jgi:hypothetical protein
MNINLLETITQLRLYVGCLGEKNQFGWWASSFFTPSSNAFLEPLFSRTQLLAQCNGATQAAALVHDERIGVGHVYHLFRLPEDLEQGLHRELHDPKFGNMIPDNVSPTRVLESLGKLALTQKAEDEGPMRIGSISDLYLVDIWKQVAGLYTSAFQQEKEIYPYYSELS